MPQIRDPFPGERLIYAQIQHPDYYGLGFHSLKTGELRNLLIDWGRCRLRLEHLPQKAFEFFSKNPEFRLPMMMVLKYHGGLPEYKLTSGDGFIGGIPEFSEVTYISAINPPDWPKPWDDKPLCPGPLVPGELQPV